MQLLHRGCLYAVCGILVLTCSSWLEAQTTEAEVVTANAYSELPDSPGAVKSQEQATTQQAQDQNSAQEPQQEPQQQPQQQPSQDQNAVQHQAQAASIETIPESQGATSPPAQAEQKPQRPVGTAAAEAPMVTGITAAQPAGVAVAPAKQHRVRTLVIKIGAIAGAAVALGTTMALTVGTPSKPPGAH